MSIKNVIFYGFLGFIPVSLAAHFLGWSDLVIFVTAALAIIPLAGWMGAATEEIAVVVGPSLGGLMNATFWQCNRANYRCVCSPSRPSKRCKV